ncbi:MAG TPA: hypothetical protein VGC62_09180 [Pseudomonas sp.]|uniref:hypothetical protein n=1 Tax=Pseudomonas sp. TaxID=306 RepID=UPI002EDB0FA5
MKRRAISAAALPAIGQPFLGGFYAGRIYFDGAEHAIIDSGHNYECAAHWWNQTGPRPRIHGATSRFDGLANTKAMSDEGSAIATKVLGMNIRGTWGWHIPSIEELQIMRSNLLQLDDWGYGPSGRNHDAPQSFGHHEYWSSSQKENAATAWCLHMLPWCVPDTNWVSGCKGVRPVRTILIIHEPVKILDAPDEAIESYQPVRFLGHPDIENVLERFVNEDTGRFYGRTDELVAALAAIGSRA